MKQLLISAVVLIMPAAAARTDDFEFELIGRTAQLLTSPFKFHQEEGEKQLQEHGERYQKSLSRALLQSTHSEQAIAARYLRILLSPWARGQEIGFLNPQYEFLYLPRHPAWRSDLHPWASSLRKTGLQALRALLDGVRHDPEHAFELDRDTLDASRLICMLLGEVGDRETVDALLKTHAAGVNAVLSLDLMLAVEWIEGLPRFFEAMNWGMGEEIRKAQLAMIGRAWHELDEWESKHANESGETRLQAGISEWAHIGEWEIDANSRRVLSRLEPLLRLGTGALPHLRRFQEGAGSRKSRAVWEIAAAAITRRPDPALLKELFLGSEEEQYRACSIILAAGSTKFREELGAIALRDRRDGYSSAAEVLAACHQRDALPILRRCENEWIKDLAVDLQRALDEAR